MKYNTILLLFLICFFKTLNSFAQADSIHAINEREIIVFQNNQKILIAYDTSSYMEDMHSITFYHFDSLNRLIKDSVIHDKRKETKHYHYINGEAKVNYTYYHNFDINISYTEIQNDTIAIFNVVKFKNNDTVVHCDTISLCYPDSGTMGYYNNNITLEALHEKRFSTMDTTGNFMRIFKVKREKDSTFAIVYTLSDILKDSLLATKKTGAYLYHSFFESKEEMIKNYSYKTTYKIVSDKKIKKIFQKMTSLEYLPIEENFENLIVEYRINGKYYLLTFSDMSIYKDFSPKMRETFKNINELVTYLDNCF